MWWQTGGRPSPLALDAVLAAVAESAPMLERLAISGSRILLHSCGAKHSRQSGCAIRHLAGGKASGHEVCRQECGALQSGGTQVIQSDRRVLRRAGTRPLVGYPYLMITVQISHGSLG